MISHIPRAGKTKETQKSYINLIYNSTKGGVISSMCKLQLRQSNKALALAYGGLLHYVERLYYKQSVILTANNKNCYVVISLTIWL